MSESNSTALTAAERKALKARAHHLNPVVIVGEAGLTQAVLAEAERAIAIHELIKIRVLGDDRDARIEMMGRVCDALSCAPVQMIGKLLVVFRPKPAVAPQADAGPHVPKKIAGSGAAKKPGTRTGARKPLASSGTDAAKRSSAGRKPAWGEGPRRSGTSSGDRVPSRSTPGRAPGSRTPESRATGATAGSKASGKWIPTGRAPRPTNRKPRLTGSTAGSPRGASRGPVRGRGTKR